MLDKRSLPHLLSLSAVFLASGFPMSGCCDTTTFEISADLSIPFPDGELQRGLSVRALGDRVRLEFSEPVRATIGGEALEPCPETENPGWTLFDDDPEDEERSVGEGGAGGGVSLGGAAGADAAPPLLGGAGGLGGQGGMNSADPPTAQPPIANPPREESEDGYSICVEIVGYNIDQVVQINRQKGSYGDSVSVKGTAIDVVKGCGWREPKEKGIVLRAAD